MDRIAVRGGRALQGTIHISGAKNAALPLMTAALLSEEPLTLTNVPDLADIGTLARVMEELGTGIGFEPDPAAPGNHGRRLTIDGGKVRAHVAPYDLVRKMRASILVLGPLLARFGEAKVSLPGGCAIGTRPVDLHLKGMQQLGAEIDLQDGYVIARAPKGLSGARIRLPFVSVGATENLLMAATLAKGETVIENAAREPEIADLADCLCAMGARIEGAGTSRLTIQGVDALSGATHAVIPDRIEAGSYAVAAGITGGAITLDGARADHLGALIEVLDRIHIAVEEVPGGLHVRPKNGRHGGVDIETQPHPGFPTDLQAQIMALLTVADGASSIHESIFENRFMHVPELMRMGADITLKGAVAVIRGVPRLKGAPVMATDLRASISLVLAGLAAEGETIVNRVYHLDRGYERVEEKLGACGADIERLSD